MEIEITAQKMELTPSLKEHVENSLKRLDKFNKEFISVKINLFVEKRRNCIHAIIKTKKNTLNAVAEGYEPMYQIIDECIRKLEKQIRRKPEQM